MKLKKRKRSLSINDHDTFGENWMNELGGADFDLRGNFLQNGRTNGLFH